MNKKMYSIITVAAIILTVFCITGTVQSKNSRKLSLNNQYEREMEKEYVCNIKQELADLGFEYAGVSLTKVVNERQEKVYTLSIHHKRIDRMNSTQRKELTEKLERIKLLDDEYQIETKFLEYNC